MLNDYQCVAGDKSIGSATFISYQTLLYTGRRTGMLSIYLKVSDWEMWLCTWEHAAAADN